MKKIKTLFLLIAIMALLFGMVPGKVSAQKFTAYVTGTQVQNLGDVEAQVTLEYYYLDTGGAGDLLADTVSDAIGANSSKTFFPVLTSFSGSMVISSSQPTAAVTNIQNAAKTAGAAYVGASSGSTTVAIPLLMKNNGSVPYDTWFSVQNASLSNANITINYSDCASPVTATIKPNASRSFFQAQEACHTQKVFSAQITSDQEIVVVVLEENISKMFAYTGFPAGAQEIVMPLINTNNSGITTGVQIQNLSSTQSEVTVSYNPSLLGTACTETQTIPGNSSATFALIAFAANNSAVDTTCVAGERFVGSARVTGNTGNADLVAIVNQSKNVYGEAYGAFDPTAATPKVVLPLIMDRNGSAQWGTGFAVMNVGDDTTFVECTFTNTGYTVEGELQPYEALTPNQKGAISAGYVGSGTCIAYTSEGGSVDDNGLVAVVNESGIATADRLLVYEGVNVEP